MHLQTASSPHLRPQLGCIVADVRMPGTDGIELARELARRQNLLAGGPHLRPRRRADGGGGIKAGAEDFIEKPVDDVQLVAAINRGMARMFSSRASRNR